MTKKIFISSKQHEEFQWHFLERCHLDKGQGLTLFLANTFFENHRGERSHPSLLCVKKLIKKIRWSTKYYMHKTKIFKKVQYLAITFFDYTKFPQISRRGCKDFAENMNSNNLHTCNDRTFRSIRCAVWFNTKTIISHKIFETNSSFYVKWHTTGKSLIGVFRKIFPSSNKHVSFVGWLFSLEFTLSFYKTS